MEITDPDNLPATPFSPSTVEVLLVLIILSSVISFHSVLQVFNCMFSCAQKIKHCADKFTVSEELEAAEGSEREQVMTVEEVKMAMEKMTTVGLEQSIDGLFEERDPSLEEVKEAFALFDENEDGFIDASELRNVLCGLSLTEASEAECTTMITAFDDDKDGRIDFCEFVKLLDRTFSS